MISSQIQLRRALVLKPTGTLIPALATLPGRDTDEVVFVIKEYAEYIKKAKASNDITIRNSIIATDGAKALVSMFMFGNSKELVYTCMFNYHDPLDRKMIEKLCIQENILFEYRDSENFNRTERFVIVNDIAPLARQYSLQSFEYGHWSKEEFDLLREGLTYTYKDVEELWEAIG